MTENKLSEKEMQEIVNFIGSNVYYDEQSQYIMAEGGKANTFLELRGWGAITSTIYKNENDAAKFQDRIGKWVVDAVNEKLTAAVTRERERTKGLVEAAKKLAQATSNLIQDVKNKPNDTRYATHTKAALISLDEYLTALTNYQKTKEQNENGHD